MTLPPRRSIQPLPENHDVVIVGDKIMFWEEVILTYGEAQSANLYSIGSITNANEQQTKEHKQKNTKPEPAKEAYTPRTDILSDKPQIELPNEGIIISDFAEQSVKILANTKTLFYRNDARQVVEIGMLKNKDEITFKGFIPISPNRFITCAERFFTAVNKVKRQDEEGNTFLIKKPKSMSPNLANTLLQSHIYENSLPNISRLFTIPIPIIHEDKLTFPKTGYDERFLSWLPQDAPNITDPTLPLDKAKELINDILKEFCFQTPQDKTNAIAAIITPFLRGMYNNFSSRTPIFFYMANRERAGKDYLAGITGIIYEGTALEEPPISHNETKSGSDEELRKKILSAFIAGRKRLHFSNNKGYIDSAVLESIATSQKHSDRLLGKNENLTFNNELEISISGNIGIRYTPDLANRSRFIRLFLDIEDANTRSFERPNLHQWVLEHRSDVLNALYALVRNWHEKGSPPGQVSFASFPEWARVCGGIMETAGYETPCAPDQESLLLGGDTETSDMKKLFEIIYERYPEQKVTKHDIKELIKVEATDLFGYIDFDKRSDQTKFGNKLSKFVGRVLSGIRMVIVDSSARSSRQEFVFKKEDVAANFGNLGNLGNLQTLETFKEVKNPIRVQMLPRLPRLPNVCTKDEVLAFVRSFLPDSCRIDELFRHYEDVLENQTIINKLLTDGDLFRDSPDTVRVLE